VNRRQVLHSLVLAGVIVGAGGGLVGLATRSPGSRTVSLGFDDVLAAGATPKPVADRLQRVGATTVAVTAGRPDWTTFRWADQTEAWSSQVAGGQSDPFAETIRSVGAGRKVVAVVDVLAERLIQQQPGLAAKDAKGVASPLRPSTTALVDGVVGERIVAMVGYLLEHYQVDAIDLTELDFYEFGYGSDDQSAYTKATGRSDWPRKSDGSVNIDDPTIGRWRSGLVATLVERVAQVVHAHGAKLLVDARVSWTGLARQGREFGQDYQVLLAHADELVLWYLPGLSGQPASVDQLLAALPAATRSRFVLSVGLWTDHGKSATERLSPAVWAAENAGLAGTWITPYGLLNSAAEQALLTGWS
jgi:hypothetical protein